MEDRVRLEEYTVSLCCDSCRVLRSETKIVRNVLSNKIEITFGIHKGLYFLPYKNYHKSLSMSRIFVLRLTITQTRLSHCSNLCSSCIGPSFFALLSIAGFLLTLRLFEAFSFIIVAKGLFPTAVFMQKVSNKSITPLRLNRSGRCKMNTRWQR